MLRWSAAGFHFRIIPAGSNAPLEFLTGFTLAPLNPRTLAPYNSQRTKRIGIIILNAMLYALRRDLFYSS
jgi:hypothetical protein